MLGAGYHRFRYGLKVPFPPERHTARVVLEQTSGEGCFDERPRSSNERWGVLFCGWFTRLRHNGFQPQRTLRFTKEILVFALEAVAASAFSGDGLGYFQKGAGGVREGRGFPIDQS